MYANTLMNLGLIARAQGNQKTANDYFADATALRRALLEYHAGNRELLRDTAIGFFNLANHAMDENNVATSIRHLQDAIAFFEKLLEEAPDDLKNKHRLSYFTTIWINFLGLLSAPLHLLNCVHNFNYKSLIVLYLSFGL